MFGPFGAHALKARVQRSPRRRCSGRLNIEELEARTLLAATGGLDLANVPLADPYGSGGSAGTYGTLSSAVIPPPGSSIPAVSANPTAEPAFTDPFVGIGAPIPGSPPILVSPLAFLSPLVLVSPLRAFDAGQQSGGGDNRPLPMWIPILLPAFLSRWQAPGTAQGSGGYVQPFSADELEVQGQPNYTTALLPQENHHPPGTPAAPAASADPAAGVHVWAMSLRQARDVYFAGKNEVPVAMNPDAVRDPVPAQQADLARDPVAMAAAFALVLGSSGTLLIHEGRRHQTTPSEIARKDQSVFKPAPPL